MIICPKCKSRRTAPIMYGYPAPDAFTASEEGKIILGGCKVINDQEQPDYGCLDCEYRWSTALLQAEDIKKLRYKVVENGLCTLDSQRRWVYEIYPDGRCVKYSYVGQSRKYVFREIENIENKRVNELFGEIQKILGAPLWERNIIETQVCDGSSYNLQITYTDNRKKVIEGDIGGGTFDSMLENFVKEIFPEE